jgi:ribosomal protein S18 acetylase RimI-like enzyme
MAPKAPYRIRKARVSDAPAVGRLLALTWRKSFSSGLSRETLKEVSRRWHNTPHLAAQIRSKACYFAVAQAPSGRLLGLVTVTRTAEWEAFLNRLFVRPGRQGGGIGERLLSKGLAAFPGARRVSLEVLESNERAAAFYRRHGFCDAGRKTEPLESGALELKIMEWRRGHE